MLNSLITSSNFLNTKIYEMHNLLKTCLIYLMNLMIEETLTLPVQHEL